MTATVSFLLGYVFCAADQGIIPTTVEVDRAASLLNLDFKDKDAWEKVDRTLMLNGAGGAQWCRIFTHQGSTLTMEELATHGYDQIVAVMDEGFVAGIAFTRIFQPSGTILFRRDFEQL